MSINDVIWFGSGLISCFLLIPIANKMEIYHNKLGGFDYVLCIVWVA